MKLQRNFGVKPSKDQKKQWKILLELKPMEILVLVMAILFFV